MAAPLRSWPNPLPNAGMNFKALHSALILLLAVAASACGGGGGSASPEPAPVPLPAPLPAGWTRLADMPAGLAKFGVAAFNDRLYVVGGYDTRTTVWIYDIASNTWSAGPALPRGTDNVAAVAVAGRVWAIGGEAGTALQAFDPVAGTWAAAPSAPSVRFAAAAGVAAGRLLVAGGWNADNTASASLTRHDVFDPAGPGWSSAAPLAVARNAAGGAVVDGRFYVVGGRSPGIRRTDQQPLSSVEVYSPASDRWDAAAPLPTARGSLAVTALAGRLYAFGGEDAAGAVSDAVERLDTASGSWTALTPMPYRSHGLGAVAVGDDIYVMGGFGGPSDAVGTESKALYRYRPGP